MSSCAASTSMSFQRVDQASYQKVLGWLHKPHVNEFFHGQGLQNTLNDLEAQVSFGASQWQHWIAAINGVQFAYLITSDVNPENNEDDRFAQHMESKETAITLDILIGEESYLGQGLATIMIRAFLQEKFRDVTKVFIDPEVANTKAIHVYEKAGFRKLEQFTAEWHPVPHWQMMVKTCDLLGSVLKRNRKAQRIKLNPPVRRDIMQKTNTQKSEIHLIGISVRTSYQQELDKMKGNIFPCVQRYFHQELFEEIPNRANPGTTFCAYTNYESDYKGSYTYFIGEEVSSIPSELPQGFEILTIPAQAYAKFTTTPAPMPDVVVNAWQSIWQMPPEELGGNRCYHTDFEIYDERASDHQNIVMDLFVGIEK